MGEARDETSRKIFITRKVTRRATRRGGLRVRSGERVGGERVLERMCAESGPRVRDVRWGVSRAAGRERAPVMKMKMPPGKVAFENDVRPDDDAPPSARVRREGSVLGAMSCGEREMDARESASERDDAEMSDSDDEGLGGDDGLNGMDLYEILGSTKEATASEIKKAYHKVALRLHPDKNLPDAAGKFQTLQKVYGVLGDAEKRKVYDETGRVDDAELSGEKFNLYEYYRGIYRKVTEETSTTSSAPSAAAKKKRKTSSTRTSSSRATCPRCSCGSCSEEAIDAHRSADVVDAVARGDAPRSPRSKGGRRRRANDRRRKSARAAREEKEKVEEGRGRG